MSGYALIHRVKRTPIFLLLLLISFILLVSLFLRSLSTELAVSMAQDAVIAAVHNVIKAQAEAARCENFLVLEKDEQGNITAVTTDMLAIDRFSSNLLLAVIESTSDRDITIQIPIGSLTGSTLLNSRGPSIKVRVQVLSSSFTGFHSELDTIGINQTRHRIVLELREEITLLMPWRTINTSVISEIPITETILLGKVPQSYFQAGD